MIQEHWTHPPFAAEIDKDGKIFARGSQDMKCCGTQYLGAIRALKKAGFTPKRTVRLSFVPEEEIGGVEGMQEFVLTEEFKALNIGFALDETIASTDEYFHLFYAERSIWRKRSLIYNLKRILKALLLFLNRRPIPDKWNSWSWIGSFTGNCGSKSNKNNE